MRTCAPALLSLLLGACAAVPPAPESGRFLADRLFAAPSQRVDARSVFALSDEMRRYLATELADVPGSKGRQQALVEALRSKAGLKLEYDAGYTRNAAQAFEARTGNCLSLVIMTAALAKEMGVGVRYQSVFVDETWSRRDDLYFSVGHVNLTLGRRPPQLGTRIDDGESITIDFLPPPELRGMNWRVIGEKTIVAMYMNNRAAESLASGRIDDAYWFAREALRQDDEFLAAYNTLGVVYQRAGRFGEAARVLAWALDREPRNTTVMSNLANAYASLGRAAEAKALESRLAALDPEPPFAFFNQGLEAMRRGDYGAARDLFAKEVDRAPYYHEFHFWLALALAQLGETEGAKRHLALAMENSTTRKEHDLYAAKLDRLRSARLH
jgi:tetratricopeptide (TPR) repeat protein